MEAISSKNSKPQTQHAIIQIGRIWSFIVNGRIVIFPFGLQIITWNFGNLPIVITIWLVMQVSTLLVVYHLYSFWATNRRLLFGDVRIMDTLFLVIYISYQTAFFVVPAYLCRVSYQVDNQSAVLKIL